MFAWDAPFFNACWDGRAFLEKIRTKWGQPNFMSPRAVLQRIVANHGWDQVEQFVLDERWDHVKKKAKKLPNAAEIRQAFEAMLLAGEVESAYRFVGRGCVKDDD